MICNYIIIIVLFVRFVRMLNEEKIKEKLGKKYILLYYMRNSRMPGRNCIVLCTYIDSFERKSGKRLYAIIIMYTRFLDTHNLHICLSCVCVYVWCVQTFVYDAYYIWYVISPDMCVVCIKVTKYGCAPHATSKPIHFLSFSP